MKAFKLFYLFTFLLSINLLTSCFCENTDYEELINLEETLAREDIEKKDKKKKLIIYSTIASAVVAALTTMLGVGLYIRKKNNKKVWNNEKTAYAGGNIYEQVLEKGRAKINESIAKGKNYFESVPSIKEINNMIKNASKDVKDMGSGQKKELLGRIAHAVRLQLINENPSKYVPQNSSNTKN